MNMDDQTAAVIERLASKLGTTADHIMAVLMAQAPISGLVYAAFTVGFILAFAVCLSIAIKGWNAHAQRGFEDRWRDPSGKTVLFSIGAVMAFMGSVAMLAALTTTISAFINPEYWALRHLFGLVAGR